MQPEKSTCPKKLSAQKALRSQSHAFLHLLIKLHFVLNATPYFVLDEVIKSVDIEPHQLAFLHPPYIHGPIFLQQFQGGSNFYTSSTVPGFFLTKLLYFFHLQQSVGDAQRRQRLQGEDITIGKKVPAPSRPQKK